MTLTPHIDEGDVVVHRGDCIAVMAAMPADSIDAIITDPPYGIDFMGKAWDRPGEMVGTALGINGGFQRFPPGVKRPEYAKSDPHVFQAWCEAWAREAMRVLKPGGHLLAFGGTRMYHRLASGIEDAGFEMRDLVAWIYGSGFPKSVNVSIAIDKAAGAEREVVGEQPDGMARWNNYRHGEDTYPLPPSVPVTAPATDAAKAWAGWGTALKPAIEPIAFARKPLIGTVVANVLEHGTGGINIDASRIDGPPGDGNWKGTTDAVGYEGGWDSTAKPNVEQHTEGRWPANVLLSDEAASDLDRQEPGAPRFFYVAKPSTAERDHGLAHLAATSLGAKGNGLARTCAKCGALWIAGCECVERTFENPARKNHHPTVKPIALMRYLVRLVTPPGGVILDPFAGSGTTLLAARRDGFRAIGIELTDEYLPIIAGRLAAEAPTLFGDAA